MITIFLAHVIGWYLLIVGLLLLLRTEAVQTAASDILAQPGLFFVLAIMTLIMGLLLVISHNIWVLGWGLIITVIAWMVLISGVVRLFFPSCAQKAAHSFLSKPMHLQIVGAVTLIVGAVLLYHVYALHLYF